MDELYRSKFLVVRPVPGLDLKRWVVTSDNHSIGAGFDRPGFSEEFLRREGISAVHVLGRGNDWYQYPGVNKALGAVVDGTAGAVRRVAYGSSMGGYAALRLGVRAGADAALALSPQWTINPARVPWEQRWASDAARIGWLDAVDGRRIKRLKQAVVAYDPKGDDRRHVDALAEETPVTRLAIDHAGHPVSTFLAESGLLRPLLVSVLYDAFDAAAFEREARARRGECVSYMAELSNRQPPHRARLALALSRRALAIRPGDVVALTTLGRRLSAAGEHEEALRTLDRAVAASRGDIGCTVPYAEALANAGRLDGAIAVARDVADAHPERGHLRHWLGWLQWRDGREQDALDSQTLAVRLDPGNPLFADKLADYRRRAEAPAPPHGAEKPLDATE